MSEDERTTGTTPQDGGDAAETQTTGTPETVDRNADSAPDDTTQELESLRKFKAQALAEKGSLEEAKRKIAEYESRANQPPTTDPRGSDDEALRRSRAHLQMLQQLAASDDPATQAVASVALATFAQNHQLMAALQERDALDDEAQDTRAQVKRLMREQGVDLKTAKELVSRDQKIAELEAKLAAKTTTSEEATARRDAAPSTSMRPVTAAELASRRIKRSDYNARMESLPDAERRELFRKVNAGVMQLVED